MGKLFAGPWCDFRGRVGNNVGRYVNGENILAIKPHKSNKPATAVQLNHQDIFGTINSIVSWWKNPIADGFRNSSKMSPRGAAVKYNLKHAVMGEKPNQEIDYEKLCFSRGHLAQASKATVINKVDEEYYITFSWTMDDIDVTANPADLISLIVYCPSIGGNTGHAKFIERSKLTFDLAIPRKFHGNQLECYICFTSPDGKKASDSQYVGSLLKT